MPIDDPENFTAVLEDERRTAREQDLGAESDPTWREARADEDEPTTKAGKARRYPRDIYHEGIPY